MRRLLFALLSFCILYGCQEPDVVPEPLPPIEIILPPVVSASADTTINYGDSISINWSVKNSVTCNVAVIGSKTFNTLLKDATISIVATNTSGSTTKTISIKVRDWTSSTFGLLTHAKWKNVIFERLNSKKEVIDQIFMDKREWSYSQDWIAKVYDDGLYKGYFTWKLKNGNILIGSAVSHIESVTKDNLVLTYPILNSDMFFQERYIH